MAELSLAAAAERLNRTPAAIAKHAVVAITDKQVEKALAAKRLPGRKIGRTWLFQPEHVLRFRLVRRRAGRPASDD